MNMIKTELTPEEVQDLIYIVNGVFYPLGGFMDDREYQSVVEAMSLADGSPWTLPIHLAISPEVYDKCKSGGTVGLAYQGKTIGTLENACVYRITVEEIGKIYGTTSEKHPGVRKEKERGAYRLGGRINLQDDSVLDGALSPAQTKAVFRERGWRSVAGFQTRNALHRAHEYLQRVALEVCDGLFINPVTGWKKAGDFTEAAVMAAYQKMADDFYPKDRVYLAGLKTQMRYAGPREAVFHAIVRRNLGCTHFIIGRDHAGVGDFYGLYEAHELAGRIAKGGKLGIELLLLHGPFYCEKCGQIATDMTCGHEEKYRISVSGTKMRQSLLAGDIPDERFMRAEISACLLSLGRENIFVS